MWKDVDEDEIDGEVTLSDPPTSAFALEDNEPWKHEKKHMPYLWISRPEFIHLMRTLMSLNDTQGNLRNLNLLFSSFDIDTDHRMNVREFIVVVEDLRQERKLSVFRKPDVNKIFDDASPPTP